MKKSNVCQATLFQSWGRPAQSTSLRSTNSKTPGAIKSQVYNDAVDLIEIGDDDGDDELLAAAEGMFPFDEVAFEAKYSGGCEVNANNITEKSDEVEIIPGFDVEAGNVWIYPTNYPIRNYQFDIVEKALYKNTLVTLPTGLGKTFIAAVVMYNFFRWYPQGKVIFMAPTKPLVAQQIEACYKIMGIPLSDTAEMTGNMAPNKRQSLWRMRRVFFLTPQVLQNDLIRGSCKAEEVILLVADEAHKALGNHAYCQVVREISGYNRNFRVLALSATPGDDLEAVQQVITNLLISHMELRSEESPDIQPYTHSRQVEKVVVSLGEDIAKVKSSYLKILEAIVGRLFCQRVLWNKDPQRVTKFMLLTARDQFRKRMNEQGGCDRNRLGQIEGDFAMCISLYHAYELLLQHGILSFYNFIKAIIDGTRGMPRAKAEIMKHHEFTQLMDELREEIEPPVENSANESLLFSQFSPRRRALMNVPKPSTTFKSHPKLLKLKEIVLEHFEKFQGKSDEDSKGVATRVMIFSQYRDSVNEIAALLSRHKPLVRVMSFIGQQTTGKSVRGLSQKEQLQVVQRFRQGGYNTLVATCVGEEGLDIGEVDLIVCFDAHASPIRLVQRMGRTGRKRDGRIVVLVTEGKEEQVYMKSQRSKKSIHKAVAQATKSFDLYSDNPRMVPRHIVPSVLKMEMTVGKFIGQSKGKKKERPSEGADIKNFTSKTATTTSKKDNGLLTYEELVYWQEHFKLPDHEAGLSPQLAITKKSRRSSAGARKSVVQPSLTEWLPWQTTLQPVKAVSHSRRTEHFVELLEFTELHSGGGVDDESYDLEMMSFLNEGDIIKPGQKESDENNSVLPENDGTVCEGSKGRRKVTKKSKKTRKKLEMEGGPDLQVDRKYPSKEENLVGDTSDKNSKISGTKLKKRSPKNKARWKAFLKQLDDKEDEDFQTDGMNVASGVDEDDEVGNCLLGQPGDTLMEDLPDVGEHWEPDKNPTEADGECASLGDKKEPEKMEGNLDGDGSDLSDAASDEMTSLFPSVTTQSQGTMPGFLPQKNRFSVTVGAVPSPPNLDALDKMSLSSESSDLNDFNKDMEEIQRKYFVNSLDSGADLPRVCVEKDSLEEEPFLMADFLDTEVMERKDLENSSKEQKDFVSSFSNENKPYKDQVIYQEMHNSTYGNPKPSHGVDMLEEQDEIAARRKSYAQEVTMNVRGISNSFLSELESNVLAKAVNDSGKEEKGYTEDLFMDAADDDALTDIALPTDGNVGEKYAKDDKNRPGDETLSPRSEHVGERSIKKDNHEAKKCQARLEISERVGEQFCTAGSSVKMDQKSSKSHGINGLRHLSTNEQNSRNDGTEKIFQEGIELRASSSLEIRTRGEHPSSTSHNDIFISDIKESRNSGATPFIETESLQSGKLDLGNKHQPGYSWNELPSSEINKESHINALGKKVTVINESGSVGHNVGDNGGRNVGINTGDSVGSNAANNPCRSPLPKKLKLSLKRTSPKDKRSLPMKTKDNGLPFPGTKSLNLSRSKSLSDKSVNDNSCGVNIEIPEVNSLARPMECSSPETSVKQSSKTSMAFTGSSLDREEHLANSSNLRTENGNVVAVMESDDEDESVIRPVGRAISRRKRVLSSPCSQEFRKPASPEKSKSNQRIGFSSCNLQLESNSDEEFETGKPARSRSDVGRAPSATFRTRKRNSFEIGGKQRSRKSVSSLPKKINNRFRKNHFLDDEAELSDSDINDFSSDEADNCDEDEDEMDSFIDDAAQLTQRPPSAAKQHHASSPVDMMAVYRQSLRSPLCGALKFRTPLFHKQRNKYKMVYKRGNVDDDSQSEAEETYESESVLENEVKSDNESEAEIEHETEVENGHWNGQACADVSFEGSQIGRPAKRMKRKRILDDSFDGEVSLKLGKVNSSAIGNKEGSNAEDTTKPDTSQMKKTNQHRSCAFGNFSIERNGSGKMLHTDFVKSSDVVAAKKEFQRSDSALRRSAGGKGSIRKSGAFVDDWSNDVSDGDLLIALDDKDVRAPENAKAKRKPSSDQLKVDGLDQIDVAMDIIDNDAAMDIKKSPNFSLGFDFLWEVVYANRENTENDDSSKEKSAILKQKNEISKETFTKIRQCSNQTSQKWYQLPVDPQARNKGFVEKAPRPFTTKQIVVPLNVTKSNICEDKTVISGQRHLLKNPLTLQNKSSLHNGGQHPSVGTHAKMQVVTPSCRPNNLGSRPAISHLLTSSQKDKGKTVILVDAREISSSQVVSTLRLKHNIKAEVCQLTSCDYIVSNRMAVKRKTASDVAHGANSHKLVECIRRMCDLYDRPCLIIEKDRVKPGETEKNFIKTKAYIFTLASIAQTHVKMVFSDSQEETARLLTDLATVETMKGMAITASTALNKEHEQFFRVVASIPRVSYVTALNLCSSYRTLGEIVNSTPAELEKRTPGLSSPRAAEIHKYLRHKFNSNMISVKK